jgi:ADP-ribose pyrophosphatase
MINSNSLVERPKSVQRRPSTANLVFNGVLFDVWQWEQTLFDGTKALFETLSRPDTVLILPVTNDAHVILAKETQPGMPTKLQALGGRIELGELPEDAARRELLEESGYIADELRLWDAWQPVNKIDWAVYLYVAHGLNVSSDVNLDAGEMITLSSVPIAALLEPNSELIIDDYELLHKLYFARSDEQERARIIKLLNPHI